MISLVLLCSALYAISSVEGAANTIANDSAWMQSNEGVAEKLFNLRQSIRAGVLKHAQEDCVKNPLTCHEHQHMLTLLDSNGSFLGLDSTKDVSLHDFSKSLASLDMYLKSMNPDGSDVVSSISKNKTDDSENAILPTMFPLVQSLKSEWLSLYLTASSQLKSSDDNEGESFISTKKKYSNRSSREFQSARQRSASEKRLHFVNSMVSSVKDIVSEYVPAGLFSSSSTSGEGEDTKQPEKNSTSMFSLATVLDKMNEFVTGQPVLVVEEPEDEFDLASEVLTASNVYGPDSATVESIFHEKKSLTSQDVLEMFPLDKHYEKKSGSGKSHSKNQTSDQLQTLADGDDDDDDDEEEVVYPCNFGKEITAKKNEYVCAGHPVPKSEYDDIMANPVLVPNYPASQPFTEENLCAQTDFFFDNTFLGTYLSTILTPEKIAELEERNAPRKDYIFAICAVVATRSVDAETVTPDNENQGQGGSDIDWCLRQLQCQARSKCSHRLYSRKICVCPYGYYGPRCATPNLRACRLVFDESSPFNPTQHGTSTCSGGVIPPEMGPQWNKFENIQRPGFLPLGPHSSCIAAQDPSSAAIKLGTRVDCRFTQPIYQGVTPALVKMMGLEGYFWDTNYEFDYAVYRPASEDPEASYGYRDQPDAVKPAYVMLDESIYPYDMKTNSTVSTIVRPINWSKISDQSLATKVVLSDTDLSSVSPPLVEATIDFSEVLETKNDPKLDRKKRKGNRSYSPFIPGGRITWEARALVEGSLAITHVVSGVSWTVDDLEFHPGTPRGPPLSSLAIALIIIGSLVVFFLIIMGIRAWRRSREEDFFQQLRHVSMKDAQERAAAAVFAHDEDSNGADADAEDDGLKKRTSVMTSQSRSKSIMAIKNDEAEA